MLAIPALLGEHVTGPYEGQPKPPLEVVVVTKGVSTCGDCPDLENCPTVGAILENNPVALENLKG